MSLRYASKEGIHDICWCQSLHKSLGRSAVFVISFKIRIYFHFHSFLQLFYFKMKETMMTSNSYKSFAMREICISVLAIFNLHFLKLVFEREAKFKVWSKNHWLSHRKSLIKQQLLFNYLSHTIIITVAQGLYTQGAHKHVSQNPICQTPMILHKLS